MSFPLRMPRVRRIGAVAAAVLFAAGVAYGQSTTSSPSNDTSSSASSSSSQSGLTQTELAEFAPPGAPTPSASASPSGGGAGGGQYGNSGGSHDGVFHHWAFEAGGGFNSPISSSVTFGGNFTLGAGLKFNKYLSGLIEYQYIDDKLPGALIAETYSDGGNAHIWSFTIDPVIDLMPKATNDVYITGGGGFYRKVTNFTDLDEEEYCYYYCEVGEASIVAGHFSSNQGGWSAGAGFQHRLGGMSGDGNTKLFVEARYLDVLTPAYNSSPNGLGTVLVNEDTKMIPVTLGVRF